MFRNKGFPLGRCAWLVGMALLGKEAPRSHAGEPVGSGACCDPITVTCAIAPASVCSTTGRVYAGDGVPCQVCSADSGIPGAPCVENANCVTCTAGPSRGAACSSNAACAGGSAGMSFCVGGLNDNGPCSTAAECPSGECVLSQCSGSCVGTCGCACTTDVVAPYSPTGLPDFGDLSAILNCANGLPADCSRADVNCDGNVDHADFGVAVHQFRGLPGGCEIPTGACCRPDDSCVHVQEFVCAGGPDIPPQLTGVYQGDGSSCSPNPCAGPSCGDGAVNQPTEQCDNGSANSDTLPDACRTDCTLPSCGDNVADTGEECDGADDAACAANESCTAGCVCACACDADVNNDGQVLINDVFAVTDCATGVTPPSQCLDEDINCDGEANFCDVAVATRAFQGHPDPCGVVCGACCLPDNSCTFAEQTYCESTLSGEYQGDNSFCVGGGCDTLPPPPELAIDDTCHGGINDGLPCTNSNQCGGGICGLTDRCDAGANHGQPCANHADCPGGRCGAKSAYVTIRPTAPFLNVAMGPVQAIKVTLVDLPEFPNCNGEVRWVGPPQSFLEDNGGGTFVGAETQMIAFFDDWSGVPNLHIFGDAIVPNSTYEVRQCDMAMNCGTPLTIVTQLWGDIVPPYGPPSGLNFVDIRAVVDKFTMLPVRLSKTRTQLQPNPPDPNDPVDFRDIAAVVDAFRGKKFSDVFDGPSGCP